MKKSSFAVFFISWSVVGYPFLALLGAALGFGTTSWSIMFRGLALGLALVFFLLNVGRCSRFVFFLLFSFWLVYLVKLLWETSLNADELSQPVFFYWSLALGASFVPAVASITVSQLAVPGRVLVFLVAICVVSSVLSLVFATTETVSSLGYLYDIGRLNVSSLNPISLGHVGVTSVLLGMCLIVAGRRQRHESEHRHYFIAAVLIGLGLSVALQANSRGPLVSLFCAFTLVLMGRFRSKRGQILIFMGAVVCLFVLSISERAVSSIMLVWDRFSVLGAGGDITSLERVLLYQEAIREFLTHPIFGGQIELVSTGTYPHNLVLEAFMTTGLAGGVPFLTLVLLAIAKAWRLVRTNDVHMWVGVLAVQYIAGAMLSGSIYGSGPFWISIAFLLSPAIGDRLSPRFAVQRRFRHAKDHQVV